MMPVKRKGTQGTSEDRPIEDGLKKQTIELDDKVEERKKWKNQRCNSEIT